MDDERLIALVREHTELYDSESIKYSDNAYKEKIWKTISQQLNTTATATKNRWTSLRDQWRKYRKRRYTKYVPSYSKKWRYEDQMSFLIPFIRFKKSPGTEDDSTEPIDEDFVTEEIKIQFDTENFDDNDSQASVSIKQENMNFSSVTTVVPKPYSETASSVQFVNTEDAGQSRGPGESEDVDKFFAAIAAKVKHFTPYYRNVVESKIFALVQEMELEQIMQNQSNINM